MSKVFKEPLFYFLLIGALLFGLARLLSGDGQGEDEIFVSKAQVQSLIDTYTRVWQRPPDEQVLEKLIDEFVREQVYYRQALAMGLDKDDPIIRRRLRQKLEFISEDLVILDDPGDEVLQSFLDEHAKQFRREARYDFFQVYFNDQKHGDSLESLMNETLAALKNNELDREQAGDALMVRSHFLDASESEIVRALGRQFLASLSLIPLATWSGPIKTPLGSHLIFIERKTDSRKPSLAEVRPAVLQAFLRAKRDQENEAFYQKLRQQFTVTIHRP